MESVFDRKAFNSITAAANRMVDADYSRCLHKCVEDPLMNNLGGCKQTCFKTIMVPHKIIMHQSQDAEENLYRQCLAEKFPNVSQEDFISCTKNIYAQRYELVSTHFANTAEAVLKHIH